MAQAHPNNGGDDDCDMAVAAAASGRACPLPLPPPDGTPVTPVRVRLARHDEARAITRYLDWHLTQHADLSFGHNQDSIMEAAADGTLWVVLATADEALAGFLVTIPPYTLGIVEVCAPWRRRGVGAAAVRAWEAAVCATAPRCADSRVVVVAADRVLRPAEPFWTALGYVPIHTDGREQDTWIRAANGRQFPTPSLPPRHVAGHTLRPRRGACIKGDAAMPAEPTVAAAATCPVAAALFADGSTAAYWEGSSYAAADGTLDPPLLAVTRLTGMTLVVVAGGALAYAGRPHGDGAGTAVVELGTRAARAMVLHRVHRARRRPHSAAPRLSAAAAAWVGRVLYDEYILE